MKTIVHWIWSKGDHMSQSFVN